MDANSWALRGAEGVRGWGHKYLGDLWARQSGDRSALFNFVFEARVTMSFYCGAGADSAIRAAAHYLSVFCNIL